MVGLYETAIDARRCRDVAQPDGEQKTIRPKVVASTPTVRGAETQIKALFLTQFSVTVPAEEKPTACTRGVTAQGRSPKMIFLRTYFALPGAAQNAYFANGGMPPFGCGFSPAPQPHADSLHA